MNKDVFKGKWTEIKGKLKQQWAELTDDDLTSIEGKYDELVGKLQQRYGFQKDKAQQDIDKFLTENKYDE